MSEAFKKYLIETRNASEKTLHFYLADKNTCNSYLKKHFGVEAEQVTSKEIDLFITYKQQNSTSSAAYKRMRSALEAYKAFLSFSGSSDIQHKDCSQKESPYAYKLPFYCTPERAQTLVKNCLLDTSLDGIRLSLMVQLLLYTDIRLQQLIKLTHNALVIKSEELLVSVGAKQYVFLVSSEYSALVQLYKDSCKEYLFRVAGDLNRPLSRAAAAALLRKLSIATQVSDYCLGTLQRHKRFELLREAYSKVRPRL